MGSKDGSSYRGQNYIKNDLRGNENWFELVGVRVIEGSSYRESTVVWIKKRPFLKDVTSRRNTILFLLFTYQQKSSKYDRKSK